WAGAHHERHASLGGAPNLPLARAIAGIITIDSRSMATLMLRLDHGPPTRERHAMVPNAIDQPGMVDYAAPTGTCSSEAGSCAHSSLSIRRLSRCPCRIGSSTTPSPWTPMAVGCGMV